MSRGSCQRRGTKELIVITSGTLAASAAIDPTRSVPYERIPQPSMTRRPASVKDQSKLSAAGRGDLAGPPGRR